MPSADRPPVQVHLLPSLIPPGALKGGVAIVTDVLRATTCMVHALAAGCARIIPCEEVDEARSVAAGLPPGSYFLAGERQGVPIEGFAMGNSPGDCTPERCLGKTMVMTTTNGTRAILASREAERVLIGAFVNLGAILAEIREDSRPVHVVCSGTNGRISLEDTAFAGAVVAAWIRARPDAYVGAPPPLEDEAWLAHSLWEAIGQDYEEPGTYQEGLAKALEMGRGGRRVRELGYEADIQRSASLDHFDLVAELVADPWRIIKGR